MIKKFKGFFSGLFISVWVILFALILRWSMLEVYILPFHGMIPTLFPNDHIIVNKLAYGLRMPFSSRYISKWSKPKRGDVIIFRSPFDPDSLSIRRVVGLPGDRVFYENGNLYINEKRIKKQIPSKRKKNFSWVRDEDFSDGGKTEDKSHYVHWEETLSNSSYSILLKKRKQSYLIFGPYRIPPRYYFVMGDHRDQSQDSRTWPARLQKAKGKVTFSRLSAEGDGAVLIPKGTLVRTKDLELPEYFETQQDVFLKQLFQDVEVRARKAGLAGNVEAGQISIIEGTLSKKLGVGNGNALTGGRDENLVSESDILGRLSRVGFSCEQVLTVSAFLCDPRSIRWGRTFTPVY